MATEGTSGSASGGQLEEKTDYTIETNLALAQCASLLLEDDDEVAAGGEGGMKSLISTSTLNDVLQILYTVEKRCRVGNDHNNLVRIVTRAIEICYQLYTTSVSTSVSSTASVTAATSNEYHTILLSTITTLVNKRSQKVAAIRAIVTTALPWCIDMSPTDTTGSSTTTTMPYKPISVMNNDPILKKYRDELIVCLRTITSGKLFLEREHATLTRTLAYIYEQEGDSSSSTAATATTNSNIGMAADLLQEVHVETYGTLSKKEKIDYILEQLRCTILKQDFVRASIVAGKINRKHFQDTTTTTTTTGAIPAPVLVLQDPVLAQYKIQYFTLLSKIHRHEQNEMELVKDYHAIYLTQLQQQKQQDSNSNNNDGTKSSGSSVKLDFEAIWKNFSDDDAATGVEAMEQDTSITTPSWKASLQAVIVFLLLAPYSNEQQDILHHISIDTNFETIPIFQSVVQMLLKKEIIQYPIPHLEEIEKLSVFTEDGLGQYWHTILYRRIIQHNIRIVSMYYEQIHLHRLAQLLQLPHEVLEEEITTMVFHKTIYAKINRPLDIVRFVPKRSSDHILTAWSQQIEQLLHLVETTTHLIHKEQMTSLSK